MNGKITAVHVDGFRPRIGLRLVTGGMLSQSDYQTLLAKHAVNEYDPSLGVLAVRAGHIERDVLNAVLREILLSSIGVMLEWPAPKTKFKKGQGTSDFTISPVAVNAVLEAVAKRRAHWQELWNSIAPDIPPHTAYPYLVKPAGLDGAVSQEVAAVVIASNGRHTLDEVAGLCALTRFETTHVLGHLITNGVLDIADSAQDASPVPTEVPSTAVVPQESNFVPDTSISVGASRLDDDEPDALEPDDEADHTDDDEQASTSVDTGTLLNLAPDVLEAVARAEQEVEDDEDTVLAAADEPLPNGTDKSVAPDETATMLSELEDWEKAHKPTTGAIPLPADLPDHAEPVPAATAPTQQEPPVAPPLFVGTADVDRTKNEGPTAPLSEEASAVSEVEQPAPDVQPEPHTNSETPLTPRQRRAQEEVDLALRFLEAAQASLEAANADYNAHEATLAGAETTVSHYERFLADAEAEREEAAAQAEQYSTDPERNEEVRASAEQKVEDAHRADAEAVQKVVDLTAKIAELQAELETARDTTVETSEAVQVATSDRDNIVRTLDSATEKAAGFAAELAAAEETATSYRDQLTEAQKMHEALAQNTTTVKERVDSANYRVEQAVQTLANKQASLSALTAN